jgi:ATP-dependent DNA ligase
VIVQDEHGASDFDALKFAIRCQPQRLLFYAFDLLHLNGKDLRNSPLLERRAELKKLIGRKPNGPIPKTVLANRHYSRMKNDEVPYIRNGDGRADLFAQPGTGTGATGCIDGTD